MIDDEPQFTQSELVELFDLNPVTIQGWVNRRLIELKAEQNPGRASRRFYAASDIVKLVAMQHLTSLGISASDAAYIANNQIVECFKELSAKDNKARYPFSFCKMRTYSDTDEGHGSVHYSEEDNDPFDGNKIFAKDFMYLHIDITKLIRSVTCRLFERVFDETMNDE